MGAAVDVTQAPPSPCGVRLWLVRHALPQVAPGTCYGATDVPADPTATRTVAGRLAAGLPTHATVLHSTLQRCEQLALNLQALRPDLTPIPEPRLREMDFGSWEGRAWDAIARSDIDAWTAAFASYRPGSGENLAEMLARVAAVLGTCMAEAQVASAATRDPRAPPPRDVVWITHAGVIRCVAWLLAHGEGPLPLSHEWPVAAPGWGEWRRVELPAALRRCE